MKKNKKSLETFLKKSEDWIKELVRFLKVSWYWTTNDLMKLENTIRDKIKGWKNTTEVVPMEKNQKNVETFLKGELDWLEAGPETELQILRATINGWKLAENDWKSVEGLDEKKRLSLVNNWKAEFDENILRCIVFGRDIYTSLDESERKVLLKILVKALRTFEEYITSDRKESLIRNINYLSGLIPDEPFTPNRKESDRKESVRFNYLPEPIIV